MHSTDQLHPHVVLNLAVGVPTTFPIPSFMVVRPLLQRPSRAIDFPEALAPQGIVSQNRRKLNIPLKRVLYN